MFLGLKFIDCVSTLVDFLSVPILKPINKIQYSMSSQQKAEEFIREVVALMEKYNLSISHEDFHGAFIIENYHRLNIDWFQAAHIEIMNNGKQ